MIGVVLAAGAGQRLQPLTDALPKTLLPVDGDRTILDITLRNLRSVDIEDVVVVTGFAADEIESRVPVLQRRHGVELSLIFNPKALQWNNAYSLWCAREAFRDGVLLVNGDTVHPPSMEEQLLASRSAEIVIALDDVKELGDEEMKVRLSDDGWLRQITKHMDPEVADGEYVGLTLIEQAAADSLADALEATWQRDPSLYYEDGFQEFADRGGRVATASVGAVAWVEVDNHTDLERARELACHC